MRVDLEAVGALVRSPATVVDAEAPLRTVAEILTEEAIGAALVRRSVFTEGKIRHPEGVVSERDVSHAVAAGLDPDTIRAGDVMSVDLADARHRTRSSGSQRGCSRAASGTSPSVTRKGTWASSRRETS